MIKTAVIPIAGLGTRWHPLTKVVSKELLPLVDKPVIEYVVNEALAAGIENFIFVTHPRKASIDNYIVSMGLKNIMFVTQAEPNGLGDAIMTARRHTDDQPFAVMLPDEVCLDSKPSISEAIKSFNERSKSTVVVTEVDPKVITSYGVVSNLGFVNRLVEKPTIEEAPSNLAIIGRYVFTPEIYLALDRVERYSRTNEIELTEAMELLAGRGELVATKFEGSRFDTGAKQGYVDAFVQAAKLRGML